MEKQTHNNFVNLVEPPILRRIDYKWYNYNGNMQHVFFSLKNLLKLVSAASTHWPCFCYITSTKIMLLNFDISTHILLLIYNLI